MFQTRQKTTLIFVVCSALTVVAFQNCGGSMKSMSSTSTRIQPAINIEPAISQSVAVIDMVSDGMTADQLGNYQIFSQAVYDFDKVPALQINFFTKRQLTQIQDLALLSDAEKAEAYVSITGLNSHRPMLLLKESGGDLISKISKSLDLLSDLSELKLYGLGANQIYVSNRHKIFIDIYDQRNVAAAEINDLIARTQKLKSLPKIQEALAEVSQQWNKALEVQAGESTDENNEVDKNFSISAASFKRHLNDKSINLKSFSRALEAQNLHKVLQFNKAEFRPLDEVTLRKCVWFVCWDDGYDGKMAKEYYDAMSGGYAQNSDWFGLNSYTVGISRCNLPGNVGDSKIEKTFFDANMKASKKLVYPTGCGPSSASSLLDFHWRHFGRSYFGKPFNGEAVRYSESYIDRSTGGLKYVNGVSINSLWDNLFKTDLSGGDKYVEVKPTTVGTGTSSTAPVIESASTALQQTAVVPGWTQFPKIPGFPKFPGFPGLPIPAPPTPPAPISPNMKPAETGINIISKAMNSCHYRTGTLTTPVDYVSGFRKVLAQAGSDQSIVASYNYLGGNVLPFINNTNNLATMLRQSVGKNLPAVALYSYGGGSLHYSTVLEYQIRKSLGRTNILIKPTDQPTRWVNLTDPLNIASGVFYLTK